MYHGYQMTSLAETVKELLFQDIAFLQHIGFIITIQHRLKNSLKCDPERSKGHVLNAFEAIKTS